MLNDFSHAASLSGKILTWIVQAIIHALVDLLTN